MFKRLSECFEAEYQVGPVQMNLELQCSPFAIFFPHLFACYVGGGEGSHVLVLTVFINMWGEGAKKVESGSSSGMKQKGTNGSTESGT